MLGIIWLMRYLEDSTKPILTLNKPPSAYHLNPEDGDNTVLRNSRLSTCKPTRH